MSDSSPDPATGPAQDLLDLRGLVEALPAAVLVTAPDGTCLYANRACAAIFGRGPESLLGENIGLPTAREGEPAELDIFRLGAGPGVALVEGRAIRWGGSPARLCFVQDITRLKEAEAGRRRLEEEVQHLARIESMGRLAAGVAHDINNVLAAIMATAELERKEPGDRGRRAELILQAAGRGRELTSGLLAFSRKEAASGEPVDLNRLATDEANLLRETLRGRVAVELHLDPAVPTFSGGRGAISTALMNLCVNALDAMPEGGILRLRTGRGEGGEAVLEVEDTGEGMVPEVLDRALEPFFTTKPTGKGTGLGLSMVYGTVHSHGGRVHIDSTPGRGTRVRLAFPALPGAVAGTPEAAGQAPGAESGPLRVLVVDDDALIQQAIPSLLDLVGHTPTVAGGGREALALHAGGARWDLVILDLNMPDMDGLETLRRLREAGCAAPVLVASGYADEPVLERLRALGSRAFVRKPFNLEELQAKIRLDLA